MIPYFLLFVFVWSKTLLNLCKYSVLMYWVLLLYHLGLIILIQKKRGLAISFYLANT